MKKTTNYLMDRNASVAFNKCINNNIRVYPKPLSNGSKKAKARVKIIVDYGDKIQESKEVYEQGIEMTSKIIELYTIIASRI
jgi:hypothetical protein